MSFYIPPRKTLRFLAIDLDGTLAYPTWKPGMPKSVIGEPIPENVEKLKAAHEAGYFGVINTSRHSSDMEMIIEWLREYDLMQYMYPHHAVETGKLLAHRYVDDRAVNARAKSWSD